MKRMFIVTTAALALSIGGLVSSAFAGDDSQIIVPGPQVIAPDDSQVLKPGDACTMVKPYTGQQGWVWTDGRCHHLSVSYDPNYVTEPGLIVPTNDGEACQMTGPHQGEHGYLWPDGRCHLLKPPHK